MRVKHKSFIITAERGQQVHGISLTHFTAVQEPGGLVLMEGYDDCSERTAVRLLKACVNKHWKVVLEKCKCHCQKGVHECCDVCTGYLKALATGKLRDKDAKSEPIRQKAKRYYARSVTRPA